MSLKVPIKNRGFSFNQLIVDTLDSGIQVGDSIYFKLDYWAMQAAMTSLNVKKVYSDEITKETV